MQSEQTQFVNLENKATHKNRKIFVRSLVGLIIIFIIGLLLSTFSLVYTNNTQVKETVSIENRCFFHKIENGQVVSYSGDEITELPPGVCTDEDFLITNSLKQINDLFIYQASTTAYFIQYRDGYVSFVEIPKEINVSNISLVGFEGGGLGTYYLDDGTKLIIVKDYTFCGLGSPQVITYPHTQVSGNLKIIGDTLLWLGDQLLYLSSHNGDEDFEIGKIRSIEADLKGFRLITSHEPVCESLPHTIFETNEALWVMDKPIFYKASPRNFTYLGKEYRWPGTLNIYFRDGDNYYMFDVLSLYFDSPDSTRSSEVKMIDEQALPDRLF